MREEQIGLFDDNPEYDAFVEKFKPKKTTDDCFTPDNIYEAVATWVAAEYGVDRSAFVRPFWPKGDYESFDYPEGCVVVDNPPFSLLSQIYDFYISRGIRFFLFAPTLTLFSGGRDICYISCGVPITYDNGAKVNTSFATNLDGFRLRTAPDLYKAVKSENDKNQKAATKQLPKYEYPDELLTSARAYQFSRLGIDFRVRADECVFTRALDAQREKGATIFGGGLMLAERAAAERAAAERAAAERAAAERAAAERWELSPHERELVRRMGKKGE